MSRFWTGFIWVLVLLGVLPAIASASQQGVSNIIIALAFGAAALWLLGSALNVPPMNWLFRGLSRSTPDFFRWLFYAGRRWEGARYLDPVEEAKFLSSRNKGWLVDGKNKRLSERVSYQSVLTVGGMGKGKSSCFVMPNLFMLDNRSMVVTDTSGEIYDATADTLRIRGFDVQVLDLMNITQSKAYNPLAYATSYTDIQQVAHLLIKAAPSAQNSKDPWTAPR